MNPVQIQQHQMHEWC